MITHKFNPLFLMTNVSITCCQKGKFILRVLEFTICFSYLTLDTVIVSAPRKIRKLLLSISSIAVFPHFSQLFTYILLLLLLSKVWKIYYHVLVTGHIAEKKLDLLNLHSIEECWLYPHSHWECGERGMQGETP